MGNVAETSISGSKQKFGDILVNMGIVTAEQLEQALEIQQRTPDRKINEILVDQGLITPDDVAMVLSLQLNVPFIDLKLHTVQPNAIKLVSEKLARKHTIIPLDVVGDSLVVVMASPGDIRVIEDVTAQSKMRVQPAVGVPSEIEDAIGINYKALTEIEQHLTDFTPQEEILKELENLVSQEEIDQTPIVRTVDLLIAQAVKERASDIHIEPQEDRVRVRYRVDGVLHDAMSLPLNTLDPIVSRIKIQAEMNITERRKPQDGQLSIKGDGWAADLRAATFYTSHGETVVMRILDKSLSLLTLDELGFRQDSLEMYQGILRIPYGMVLVAGPTGSGKTTSLYASINQLDRNERNIVTIEDPIEYHFHDIKQTQINPKAELTFASGLKAIMRLDPDIILVGEVRDRDTARIAVQAALTGHLLLSSIHANDAVGVLYRLADLGIEPFLISSAVIGVVSQRMIRLICPHCRESYEPPEYEKKAYYDEMGQEEITFYHGLGCNLCGDTGYLRRTGVFEILPLSDEIRRLFLLGVPMSDIKAQALAEGMVTMKRDAMLKVQAGLTTPHEVLRNVFSIGSQQEDQNGNKAESRREVICHGCSSTLSGDWEFCPNCGEQFTGYCCAKCGRDVEHDWKLCPHCGDLLDETE